MLDKQVKEEDRVGTNQRQKSRAWGELINIDQV